MTVLPIRHFPEDSVLRQKAKRVSHIDSSVQRLIDNMIETMQQANGVGLAAPQVGVPLRVIVVQFDRLLIEEIHRIRKLDIYFAVREKPVINDVTVDDALAVGMDRVARVISNGSDAPATILSQCSTELQQLLRSADIIIAKGQGNYESLDGEPGNIFFLLRAKCPLVAETLGVAVGDCVLKRQVYG